MAQTIKIKRSSVAGKVPATTDLDLGELAVNTHDGKVYTKKDNGTESIVEVTPNGLTNDNIAAGAAIADTKLATISTAGKVSNSATTATSANTASAIVARDGSGNFTAGTITAALSGNASTASAWATGRTIALTGDVTGTSAAWTGSGNISFATSIAADSIVDADVNASAAIAGTKISPDFGSQAVSTTGTITGASLIPTSSTVPTNGVYLPAANTVGIATDGVERMRIRSDGNIGIGGTGNVNISFWNQAPITGSTTAYANATSAAVQNGVTANAYGFYSSLATAASTFTLGGLTHFHATQGAFGAGSTVTSQFGFRVDNSLTGATNNYAFHCNLASATGRWNFYAAGTAPNYFAGGVRLGGTAASNELNDYEEGTFTPSIIGTTTAGTGTYSVQTGRYTKIGDRVFFTIQLVWSAHTGTGNMKIADLPFTAVNSNAGRCVLSVRYSAMTVPTDSIVQAFTDSNTNTITLESVGTVGGNAAGLALDTAATLWVSGHYET